MCSLVLASVLCGRILGQTPPTPGSREFPSIPDKVEAIAGTAATDHVVRKKLSIYSTVLGEDRPLQIFTPDDYESAKASYPTLPVLYLLDGPDHFFHATGLIDFLSDAISSFFS